MTMKKFLFLFVFSTMMIGVAYSVQHTITNVNATFSPATLNINLGDTIIFDLADAHNAIEVTEATYLANGNTSNGGFQVPFGGGTLVLEATGTYYYVCFPHASIGMKGIINVTGPTALTNINEMVQDISVSPNPATDYFNLTLSSSRETNYSVWLSDITGAMIPLQVEGQLQEGLNKTTFTMNHPMSSGLYLVYVKTAEQTYVRKLVIQ
jgi:plastocyanin